MDVANNSASFQLMANVGYLNISLLLTDAPWTDIDINVNRDEEWPPNQAIQTGRTKSGMNSLPRDLIFHLDKLTLLKQSVKF